MSIKINAILPTEETPIKEETPVEQKTPSKYTGRYQEELEVIKSCCGCPLISIGDDSFHVDTKEDAENICKKIMEVY